MRKSGEMLSGGFKESPTAVVDHLSPVGSNRKLADSKGRLADFLAWGARLQPKLGEILDPGEAMDGLPFIGGHRLH